MPGSVYEEFRSACFHLQFDPQNVGHEMSFYRVLNEQALLFYQRCHWKWNNATGWVQARGDYSTGTMTLTQNSRVVTGVGTTWSPDFEECWIAPGTDPSESAWVRIGRVASTTQILLVDPYPFTTASASAYIIRQRYIPLPRDVLAYDGMTARNNDFGPLEFVSGGQAEAYYLRTKDTGTPYVFMPGNVPAWRVGATYPDTPSAAPTLTEVAGGSLTALGTYSYKYTWVMNGVETGASPAASITLTAGNQTVRLSNLEQIGALQGRYARIYRAEVASTGLVGIYYRVGDVTTTDAIATPTDDLGTLTDYTKPYYESAQTQYIRVWPRTSDLKFELELRYQARPRTVQKRSDYLDGPPDAQNAILYGTIAAMARAMNKGGVANTYQNMADGMVDQLQRTGLSERPQQMLVKPAGRGFHMLPPNSIRLVP